MAFAIRLKLAMVVALVVRLTLILMAHYVRLHVEYVRMTVIVLQAFVQQVMTINQVVQNVPMALRLALAVFV